MISGKRMGITALFSLVLVAACANNQGKENVQNQDDTLDPTPITYTNNNQEKEFNFTSFELEVDYVDRLSYEVEYFKNKEKVKATIHEFDQQKVTGKDAFDQLSPHFQEMSFDEDTPEEEVISEVLEILGLDSPFKEFDLEVTYQNGMVKDYEK